MALMGHSHAGKTLLSSVFDPTLANWTPPCDQRIIITFPGTYPFPSSLDALLTSNNVTEVLMKEGIVYCHEAVLFRI